MLTDGSLGPEERLDPLTYDLGAELPSRRQRHPADEAYLRVLNAATALFAQRGFEATTVRDITAAAKVNVGAISYYFQSKSVLYESVLRSQLAPLLLGVRSALSRPKPALDRVELMVRAFFSHIRTHPHMAALMVREMASGRQPADPILAVMQQLLPLLAGAIGEGQRDGGIRAGDPTLLAFSTVAQPVYLNLARRAIAQVSGVDQDDDQVFDRVVEHAVTSVRAMLAAR